MGPPALPVAATAAALSLDPTFWFNSLLNGISQVFLIENAVTGIIFIIALAVSSWRAALFAVIGSAIALMGSLILGADQGSVSAGLFGFSAVLTAIALGATFYPFSPRMLFVTIVATIFTVVVQGALDTVVTPFGIPTFTAPFVFVTWIFLLPHLKFAPVLHKELVHPSAAATTIVAAHPGTVPAAAAKPGNKGKASK
jgi:urea transporter